MVASGFPDRSAGLCSCSGNRGFSCGEQGGTSRRFDVPRSILALLERQMGVMDVAREILRMVRDFTGCEATAIRLRGGENSPYFALAGWTRDRIEAEPFPCCPPPTDEPAHGVDTGLQCVCSAVIAGRTDPSLSFFTPGGSFCTNNAAELLNAPSERQMLSGGRNRCLAQGYQSVALIPLRSDGAVIGLLQLGCSTEGHFSADMMGLLEEAGTCAGIVLKRISVEEALKASSAELESRIREQTEELREVHGNLLQEKTERNEIERKLEAVETRCRTIMEGARDVIWRLDADMRFTYVSASVTSVLGYAVEDFMTLSPLDLIAPSSRERFLHACREALEIRPQGAPGPSPFRTQEIEGRHKDGSSRWLEVSVTAVIEQGRPVGILGISRDITGRKRAEQAKVDFLTTAAHELRGPLTSILGYSELLLIRSDLSSEEQRLCLSRINDQAAHLADLVTDLLEVSRMESEEAHTVNLSQQHVDTLVRATVERFREQTAPRHFEIIFSGKAPQFYLDKRIFSEVLHRILANAVKYSPQNSSIRVACTTAGEHCEISIQDRGIGMTDEQAERIFDKFYRGDSSDTAVPGLGMGMTLVKRMVDAMGGTVRVESKYGQGTTVTFTIPIRLSDTVGGGSGIEENTHR